MTRIVTTTYRYERPPKKRKAVAIDGPAVVRKRDVGPAIVTLGKGRAGNDNRPEASPPTIVRAKSKALRFAAVSSAA
jgi:hypothetical protein